MENKVREIGGYIEVDFGNKTNLFHSEGLFLNSGRNGIRYAIRAYNIKELWVPYYTCPVVWDAVNDEGCECKFYSVSKDLMPVLNCDENAFILYTNYFGVCSEKIKQLSKKYKNLIVDNAQGFYMESCGIASIYSPRKFFGVSDGGIVFCKKRLNENFEQDQSWSRFSHLLKRVDVDSNFGYSDFNKNEETLDHAPIKTISNLTKTILQNIDYEEARKKRLENYNFLKANLEKYNLYNSDITDDVPMYYPFLIEDDDLRSKLIENKIYLPQCWREMEKNCQNDSYEVYLKKYMHPLLIDQRYDIEDMKRIVNVIVNNI